MKCNHCNAEVAEGTKFCPECGNRIEQPQPLKCPQCDTVVGEGVKFCPECGSPITEPKPTTCSKCGTEIEDGERFCSNCGTPIISQQQPQQPQQVQYQQPQQVQYQQPQQGQYQQPQQGQYQQPYQGQYQQSYQGQYQQPYQSQYQQAQQGQYQQPYRQQRPQNPRLSFGEAINIAWQRFTETDGRSRRSEFWWWYLAVFIGGVILSFIPYVGNLAYPAEAFLLYAIFLRRLYDCSAPDWLCKTVSSSLILTAVFGTIWGFALDGVDLAEDLIDLFGLDKYLLFMGVFGIWYIVGLIYATKDSNPEIDPMHGPSPKYTL